MITSQHNDTDQKLLHLSDPIILSHSHYYFLKQPAHYRLREAHHRYDFITYQSYVKELPG